MDYEFPHNKYHLEYLCICVCVRVSFSLMSINGTPLVKVFEVEWEQVGPVDYSSHTML